MSAGLHFFLFANYVFNTVATFSAALKGQFTRFTKNIFSHFTLVIYMMHWLVFKYEAVRCLPYS